MPKVHARWYMALVILTAGVALCDAAAPPQIDRAKNLAKLFDAADTADEAAWDRANLALDAFLGKRDIEGVAAAAMDRRDRVRESALNQMWRFRGHSPAEPPDIHAILLANLRHKNPRLRASAARMADDFAADSPELVKALIAALDDHAIGYNPKSTVCDDAARALSMLGVNGRPAHAKLLQMARHNPSEKLRCIGLSVLGRLAEADEEKRPALIRFLTERLEAAVTKDERTVAVFRLEQLGKAAAPAVPALRGAYRCKGLDSAKDRSELRFRIAAAYLAIGAGAKEALPDLLPTLLDKKEEFKLRDRIIGFAWTLGEDGKGAWDAMRLVAADPATDHHLRKKVRQAFADLDAKK